jgi:predicted lipoprotein with Yx(FWY)xxD motif
MRRRIWILAVLGLLAAGCGSDSATTSTGPATTTAPTTSSTTSSSPAAAATLETATTSVGTALVDGSGRSVYLFLPDAQEESTCYDSCEANWPPLAGAGTAGSGVDDGLLGTTDRSDGTAQVTYDGWPLYYFAGDTVAGDTNGQGVNEVWYLVGPDGAALGTADAATSAGDVISVVDSEFGRILADGAGNTLYLFTPDAGGPSTCVEGCAAIWPPLTTVVAAGEGADGSRLGSVTRDDGSEQVTYNGWPLYYYAEDTVPGDTNGQGVNDVWYVVSATGDPVS